MSSIGWINDQSERDAAQRPTILLAEDNDDARRVYGLILRHYGFAVEEAIDGAEAVRLAMEVRPSLVLMDIGLPMLDGWEASRILKADPRTAAIPLIAFSARVDSEVDLAERGTFDGYILKPVSPTELVRRVQAYFTLLGIERDGYRGSSLRMERSRDLGPQTEAAL
jgi:CheY-like chemotaxis protein